MREQTETLAKERKGEMKAEIKPAQSTVKPESDWQTTQRLKGEAVIAVDALSKHLESIKDERMYKANQALRKLWEIE